MDHHCDSNVRPGKVERGDEYRAGVSILFGDRRLFRLLHAGITRLAPSLPARPLPATRERWRCRTVLSRLQQQCQQ